MKIITLLLSLLWFNNLAAEPVTTVRISREQIDSLGITIGALTKVTEIPLLSAPAKVVIPTAQERLVTASQAGLITELKAAMGDNVKHGAVLGLLNSPELLSLQTNYLKALSELQLASTTYQRDKKLLQEGIIASRREQETLSQLRAATLMVNEAQQLLRIAGMSAADIETLSNSHQLNSEVAIRAPMTGVVLERMAVVGTRVDLLAPLYRLANLSELWLEIALPQEKISQVKLGDWVQVENSTLRAQIRLLGQNVNPETQTLLARAVLSGAPSSIRAGQRVNIQVLQATNTPVFKIPSSALITHDGKTWLFVRNAQGFSAVLVTIVGQFSDTTLVQGKLQATDSIAHKGTVALKATWLGLGSDE